MVWNFPLFMIIGSLFLAALSLLLKKKAAYILTGVWLVIATVLDAVLLVRTATEGAFTYSMGEFPAPWGNEIRAGALEALVLLIFLIVMISSLVAGYKYLMVHIDESKHNLYCAMLNLAGAAICALVFTNDIFSGYVFIEVLTLSSCGLLIIREVGKTTLAAVRYMVLNLFGSGLFLLGVILLYSMTGHLLMVPLHESLKTIILDPEMRLSLTFSIGVLTIGLAIKSGLFPFYFWMPDTYGWATPTSASILSSIISKAYLFLLIKIYYRVIGPGVLEILPFHRILMILGMAGAVVGSIAAMRQNNINRMVALSSAAQIGYIFMSLGIGDHAAYTAAIFHMLGHSVTKSLLFLTTPRLIDKGGGSLIFHNLQGTGLKDPLAGLFFTISSFSMVGIPALAGFSSKYFITLAALDSTDKGVFYAVAFTLVISTILNALYFIRTVIRIYARPEAEKNLGEIEDVQKSKIELAFLLPGVVLLGINLFFGIFPMVTYAIIERGFLMFM